MKSIKPGWVTNNKVWQATNKNFEYGKRNWRNFAEKHKKQNPLCSHCLLEGKTKMGEISDHIIPINSGGSVWDKRNLQNLCRVHDQIKRSAESRGVILPHYGEYGDLLPAISLDLDDHDIHWNNIIYDDIPLIYQKEKNTIILGPPAVGKTTLSYSLYHGLDINLIHSDDHLSNPSDMVDKCKALINSGRAYHIEGSLSHLMLTQSDKYKPDVIIWLDSVNEFTLFRRYKEKRSIDNYHMAVGMYYLRMWDSIKIIDKNDFNIQLYRVEIV